MITYSVKEFNQLSLKQLYDVLRLRSEVFVVEQNCVYQDLDGKDSIALHVLGYVEDELVAYTRLFKPGDYFDEASIGRVVVKSTYRKFGYGYDIMNTSIDAVKHYYKTSNIRISAQCYLKQFYSNLQFKIVGEEYLEDGIPHVNMLYHG
jgi:ElaA protein